MKTNEKKRLLLVTLLCSIVVGMFLVSCEKHVTPNKLSRKITQDSWTISNFFFADSSVTLDYAEHGFAFSDGGGVAISNAPTAGGKWSVGLNKKPTILYFSNFVEEPFTRLNDDWEVQTCSSDRITLSAKNGSLENRLTFIKKK